MTSVVFIILGYLSGSMLYARIFARIFNKERMFEKSKDKNPGTANAFIHGGFWCGVCTLAGDILKGFVPVFLYIKYIAVFHYNLPAMPFVIAAPVAGHAFSLFYRFKGGKGIATTFGCLLGLLPMWQPVALLAAFFIIYSVIVRITPHFQRTLLAYFSTLLCMMLLIRPRLVALGFFIITIVVCIRMFASKEEKEKMKVKLLWMC